MCNNVCEVNTTQHETSIGYYQRRTPVLLFAKTQAYIVRETNHKSE